MFSISRADPTVAAYHGDGFIKSPWGLPYAITRFVWSPIVWKDGIRRSIYFESALYAVIDVDDGYSLRDTIDWCDQLGNSYLIAPTRTHQKPKLRAGKTLKACDRFRLVFKFEREITCYQQYVHNMKVLAKSWEGDKCWDGARFFFPSTRIEKMAQGNTMPVLALPVPDLARLASQDRQRMSGRLPNTVDKFLRTGELFQVHGEKGRALCCFRAACCLFDLGKSKSDVYGLISKAPFNRLDFSDREIVHAVDSAYAIKNKSPGM